MPASSYTIRILWAPPVTTSTAFLPVRWCS